MNILIFYSFKAYIRESVVIMTNEDDIEGQPNEPNACGCSRLPVM